MVLREILAKFGVSMNTAPLMKGNAAIGGMVGTLQRFGGVIAATTGAYGVLRLVRQVTDFGDELAKSSIKVGVAADELLGLRHAAELSGASAQSLGTGLQFIQKNAVDAANGLKEMSDDFRRVGVDVKDANGNMKTGAVLLAEVGGAIGALDSQAEKINLAKSLFGRGGTELLPLFNSGTEAIKQMTKEAGELYGTDLGKVLKDAEELDDQNTRLKAGFMGLKIAVVKELMPHALALLKWVTKITKEFRAFLKGTTLVQTAVQALGVAMGVLAVKMLAAFAIPLGIALLAALAFGLIVLAIQDVSKSTTKADTLTKQFLTTMRGAKQAEQDLINLRDAWDGFKMTVQDDKIVRGVFKGIWGFIKGIGKALGIAWGMTKKWWGLWGEAFDLMKADLAWIPDAAQKVFDKLVAGLKWVTKAFEDAWNMGAKLFNTVGKALGFTPTAFAGDPKNMVAGKPGMVSANANNIGGIGTIANDYKFIINSPHADPKAVGNDVMKRVKEEWEKEKLRTLDAQIQNAVSIPGNVG